MIKGRRNSTAAVFASPYFFAPLIYLVLGLLLLNYYQHITSKDEVNYISIAENMRGTIF